MWMESCTLNFDECGLILRLEIGHRVLCYVIFSLQAHVHETNKKENLSGYMKTIPCSPPPGGGYGVYALDCEMVCSFEMS